MTTETNPVVLRNGVEKELTPQVYGKKSPLAGTKFYAPVLDEGSAENDIKWVGISELFALANTSLRKIFADIREDNVDENTGILNEEQMKLDWADFTAGVQKLSDIEEMIDELQALQQSYALDDKFGETDDNGVKTPRALELEELIKTTAAKIKPLRVNKASIEAKYAARAAARKQKKDAAEAAKAKAVGA